MSDLSDLSDVSDVSASKPIANMSNLPSTIPAEKSLRVLVVGSGGREHSIVRACLRSPLVSKVIAAPGNGGIQSEVDCHDVAADDIGSLVELALRETVNFVIVGPEVPLSEGLADALKAAKITVFGPDRAAARLEASKSFTKAFLAKYAIPTAAGETFTDSAEAIAYMHSRPGDVVIKASGLAAGKGVILPETATAAEEAIRSMLDERMFGDSSAEIVVEDCMTGEEASIMVIVDGETFVTLPASQDHKRVGDGDSGPNTGGMGAYAPAAVVTPAIHRQVEETIIRPTLAGLKQEGIHYSGVLYIGIMITTEGPKVVEFNVRLGDPECQVLLPLIDGDPIEMFHACASGRLHEITPRFKEESAVIVVHTSGGYPGSYQKGIPVSIPHVLPDNAEIIHAGTRLNDSGTLVTDGGRVLGVVATATTLAGAVRLAYEVSTLVEFDHSHFRKDIAHRELNRGKN